MWNAPDWREIATTVGSNRRDWIIKHGGPALPGGYPADIIDAASQAAVRAPDVDSAVTEMERILVAWERRACVWPAFLSAFE